MVFHKVDQQPDRLGGVEFQGELSPRCEGTVVCIAINNNDGCTGRW